RPGGAAAGDGVPGADARARSGRLVGAIDGPDRGRAADLDRTAAAGGLHHRWREPPGPLLPAGADSDRPSPSTPPPTEVALGNPLLSRLRVHHDAVRGAVRRRGGGSGMGAEDAPVAEGEAARDLPGVALGGGAPATADHRGGGEAATIPRRLRLLAE